MRRGQGGRLHRAALKAAAAREDATEKHVVVPGPLVPARELLGDMLLEQKKFAEALRGIRGGDEEGAEPLSRLRRCGGRRRSVRATRKKRRSTRRVWSK